MIFFKCVTIHNEFLPYEICDESFVMHLSVSGNALQLGGAVYSNKLSQFCSTAEHNDLQGGTGTEILLAVAIYVSKCVTRVNGSIRSQKLKLTSKSRISTKRCDFI